MTRATLLNLSILTAAAVLGYVAAPAQAQMLNDSPNRLPQAKELLGNHHYKKTVASIDERSRDLPKFVEKTTRESLGKKWRKRASSISKTILQESKKYGFDPLFLVAVIETESSFSPTALGTSGEIGLMQLMPSTGAWIAHQFDLPWKGKKTLLNPIANIRLGAAYLSLLRERFGYDGRLYIPAYNMGPGALKEAVAQQIFPADYAKRVMKKYLGYYAQIQENAQQARAAAKALETLSLAEIDFDE